MKKNILVRSKDGENVRLEIDIRFEGVGRAQLIQWALFERRIVLQKAARDLNSEELEKINGLKIDAIDINYKMFREE